MKGNIKTLILASALTSCAVASAQISPVPQAILDGGFESANYKSFWDLTNSYIGYFDGSPDWEVELPFQTTSHVHSGTHALDLGIANPGYEEDLHGIALQYLSSPLNTSQVASASVWVWSPGQYLNCTILYMDGTHHSSTQYFNGAIARGDGYQYWDLMPLIDAGKAIECIEFYAEGSHYGPINRIIIDDVSIVKKVSRFPF